MIPLWENGKKKRTGCYRFVLYIYAAALNSAIPLKCFGNFYWKIVSETKIWACGYTTFWWKNSVLFYKCIDYCTIQWFNISGKAFWLDTSKA